VAAVFSPTKEDIMSVDFCPAAGRELGSAELSDLRITVVEGGGGSKSWRKRCVAIDLRLHPKVAVKMGLTDTDRVVGSVDDEGVWTIRRVGAGERGYSVRVGGVTRGRKTGGRPGFFYFRFSATRRAVNSVFHGIKTIECDLFEVDGDKSLFIPRVAMNGVQFQPAT
jgi:hypothetical protein